eukprot:scaffold1231_cov369-Prasinococcus_capsulatus_cf.AAC.6
MDMPASSSTAARRETMAFCAASLRQPSAMVVVQTICIAIGIEATSSTTQKAMVGEADEYQHEGHDHEEEGNAQKHLLEVGTLVYRTDHSGGLAKEGLRARSADDGLDLTARDGRAHLSEVAVTHSDGQGFAGEGGLVHLDKLVPVDDDVCGDRSPRREHYAVAGHEHRGVYGLESPVPLHLGHRLQALL